MGQEVTGEATEVTLMRNAFGQRPGVGQVGREGPMIRRAQRSEFLSQYLSIYLLPSAFPIQSHQIVTYTHTHTPIQTSYDTGDICLIMSDSLRPHGLYSAKAPLSMEFSSGQPFPSPEDLPDPGIKLGSPALAGRFFTIVIAMLSGKQTHSEEQYRQWSAVYYTGGPKAKSPLSQGPRPAFVKIFYTPCVRVQTHHPNSLETYINKGRVNTTTITPSFKCYVFKQSIINKPAVTFQTVNNQQACGHVLTN